MNIKRLLKELDFSCQKDDFKVMKEGSDQIVHILKKEIKKRKINAEVFIGGSFAKKTLIKSSEYDVDIFVRFLEGGEISKNLERIIPKNLFGSLEKVHGSRDYFRIKDGKFVFEIIPVKKISRPKEMENVTDLSYFHVNYVKKRINEKLAREIALAKAFCKANEVYGAESYVGGFSGYALECLIIHYKDFERMLRELVKVKDKIILDPEKKYKKKESIMVELNQSRLQSPIVLVDPTWKERNVIAALSKESFAKFQEAARNFLKKPTLDFFKIKKVDCSALEREAENNEADFAHIRLKTDRQEGDIAGTKMKKFSDFIINETGKYFDVRKRVFEYNGKKGADLFVIAKRKKEVIKRGPPIEFGMERAVEAFKRANKNTFEKEGRLYARVYIKDRLSKFLKNFKDKEKEKIKSMGITKIEID